MVVVRSLLCYSLSSVCVVCNWAEASLGKTDTRDGGMYVMAFPKGFCVHATSIKYLSYVFSYMISIDRAKRLIVYVCVLARGLGAWYAVRICWIIQIRQSYAKGASQFFFPFFRFSSFTTKGGAVKKEKRKK